MSLRLNLQDKKLNSLQVTTSTNLVETRVGRGHPHLLKGEINIRTQLGYNKKITQRLLLLLLFV